MRAEVAALACARLAGVARCALLLAATHSCSVSLDEPLLPPEQAPVARSLEACRPLPGVGETLDGRLMSLPGGALGDGTALVVADGLGDGDGAAGFEIPSTACAGGERELEARPIVDTAALGGDVSAHPRALVRAGNAALVFFVAERANEGSIYGPVALGTGVARWDSVAARFAAPVLLWTADRPSYGSGAVADSTHVYAFGGLAARFLSADVYVARAELGRVEDPGSWEYWGGGGSWSTRADAAWPVVEGGTEPSVAYHPGLGRWLLAYSTPLATEITVRSGLGPAGPWSRPHLAARCALPASDPESFCRDVVLHPAFSSPDGLAVSHGVGSFHRALSAPAEDYRARWAALPLPQSLP